MKKSRVFGDERFKGGEIGDRRIYLHLAEIGIDHSQKSETESPGT